MRSKTKLEARYVLFVLNFIHIYIHVHVHIHVHMHICTCNYFYSEKDDVYSLAIVG